MPSTANISSRTEEAPREWPSCDLLATIGSLATNIGTTLEQVGGEAVAQRVQRHGLLDPGRVGRYVKQAAQLAGGHRLAAPVAGKQPAFGHGCSGIVSRWARLPPLAQQTEGLR